MSSAHLLTQARRGLSVVEYRLRLSRCDPRSGAAVVGPETRWIRLRLMSGANEWVASWPLLLEVGRRP